ncbi:hypothetical protein NA56DRAFT_701820 [Hyaloscypha hepaticicola]|uniref:DNA2/NAM7 helicase-like C-terminal domain-containing protein n=1 Tax=Hyaloscypha hepaticicola TaxID=2082293 RepID=A0A2J6Q927_9HELO|nr:hypothetical protein NA56DRAFT_701820 [Hyaloscypha hepaticicola]
MIYPTSSRREWIFYMPAHESQAQMLLGISHAFAENGWGTTWEQYKIKERFDPRGPQQMLFCSAAREGIPYQIRLSSRKQRVRNRDLDKGDNGRGIISCRRWYRRIWRFTPEDGIQSPPADDGNRVDYLPGREEVVEDQDDHLSSRSEAGSSEYETATEDGTQSTPPELVEETNVASADVALKQGEAGAALEKASEPAADPTQPENNSPFAGIDFSTQVAILICHSPPTRRFYNFVEGTTKEEVDSIFKTCLPDEIVYLEKFLPRVPQSVLMIRGAAGVGKTSFSTRVLHLQLVRKKVVLTMAATNQATNNICDRTIAQLGDAYNDALRALYIREILRASNEFGGITVATANSFMGWEKSYVFVDFMVAANLGGKVGFVADRHRIAVCLIRQTQFLVVLADTRCTIAKNDDPDATTAATEEEKAALQLELDNKYKLDCLKSLWKYFEGTKRIVYEDANKICQPIMVRQITQEDVTTAQANIDAVRVTLSTRRGEGVEEGGCGQYGAGTQTWSNPTPPAPKHLPVRESFFSADHPSILLPDNIQEAAVNVEERLRNQENIELFQPPVVVRICDAILTFNLYQCSIRYELSTWYLLAPIHKELRSRNLGLAIFNDSAVEVHGLVVRVEMDLTETVQGYSPSSTSSSSVPGPGTASSASLSILGIDSAPIAPSNSSRFPKPAGKLSEGKGESKGNDEEPRCIGVV